MKNLPWSYTGWLLRDMARGPLLIMAGAAGLALLIPAIGGVPPELVQSAFPYILEAACFSAVIILNRSIVSSEMARSYYRVFFSRPVQPGGYYLLRWLLGGAAVLVFAALLTGIAAWKYGASLPVLMYLAHIAMQYMVLGGLIFLLSSLIKQDAGPALALCALSAYYHAADYPPLWLKLIGWLLPPLNLCRIDAAPRYAGLHWPALLYGLCAAGAAVAVLQYRYFGEGGRGD